MAESPIFERCAQQIEERTALSRLPARGTIRLALRESGLYSQSVNPWEMSFVLKDVLPEMLESRGVENAREVCTGLIADLERNHFESERAEPRAEDVFRRFFGETERGA